MIKKVNISMIVLVVVAFHLLSLPRLVFADDDRTGNSMPTLERIRKNKVFRMGYRPSAPPMSYIENGSTTPKGYSIDLCMEIFNAVKSTTDIDTLTPDFVAVSTERRFEQLIQGEIDILCGTTTKTLERSKIVDFTLPTFITGGAFLSRATQRIERIGDLLGMTVAVVKNTTTNRVLEHKIDKADIFTSVVKTDSVEEGMKLIVDGNVDAFASDQVILLGLHESVDDMENYYVSRQLFSFELYAFAVRKNDADFRLIADQVLAGMYRNGEIYGQLRKSFGSFPGGIPPILSTLYSLNAIPSNTKQTSESDWQSELADRNIQRFNLINDFIMPRNFSDLATATSVIVAIMVFIVTTFRSRIINRRQHTLSVLALINDDNPVSRAQLEIAVWIRENRYIEDDNVDPEQDKIIIAILDFYDFVCHTAEQKRLDVETIVTLVGGRMRATYNLLKHYIHARRKELGRDSLYAPFERFVKERVRGRDV